MNSNGAQVPEVPDLSTSVEDAAEAAATIVSDVPVAGSVMAAAVYQEVSRRQNRRLEGFLRDLRERWREIEDQINRDFYGTEEFKDLVEEIVSGAGDTRQDEKLEVYRNLFLNTLQTPEPSFNDAAEIAALIRRWQPSHIHFLKRLEGYRRGLQTEVRVSGPHDRYPPSTDRDSQLRQKAPMAIARALNPIQSGEGETWTASRVRRVWQGLFSAGVVTYESELEHEEDKDWATRVRATYRLTEFGEDVVRFLADPTEFQ